MQSKVMNSYTKNGVTYLKYKILDEYDFVNHAVSTRHGGVSEKEHLRTMNLGSNTEDSKENIIENYRRFCKAADFELGNLVLAKQTHSANVRYVGREDAGKGVLYERDYTDVDALITDIPGIGLVIHTADCVPVAFIDTKNKVIGNAHCGWRGTFENLAAKTLEAMTKRFGTDPKDTVCTVGPAICDKCYEVSKDLYDKFMEKFGFKDAIYEKNGRFYLNLMLINKHALEICGVEKIAVSDKCTCCDTVNFFSHRGLGPKRGIIASVICIKQPNER